MAPLPARPSSILLRPLTATALALVGYALIPVRPGPATTAAIVTGTLGIVVFVWVVGRQARQIMRSPRPMLTAIGALALLSTLFVLCFSLTYVALSASDPAAFSQPIDKIAGIYFAMTVLTTVGFGDIVAATSLARLTVVAQMIADIVLLAAVAKLLIGIARAARPQPSPGTATS
jgi:hypothetical protein